MWLSAVLLLTMVLTVREVFILGHYDPPNTGRKQQLAYNKPQTWCHKTVETTIYLLFQIFD